MIKALLACLPQRSAREPENRRLVEVVAARYMHDSPKFDDAGVRDEFERWLDEDPRRQLAYESLQNTWRDQSLVAALRQYDSDRSRGGENGRVARPLFAVRYGAVACACVLAVALSFYWFDYTTSADVFNTSTAQRSVFELEDGSSVHLNARSNVNISYSAKARTADIVRGEVFFDIAANPSRPFVITTPQVRVTVLGTRFNVDSIKHRTTVSVYEGKVELLSSREDQETVYLTAGQRAAVVDGEINRLSDFKLAGHTDWRQGWIESENEPLGQFIARLNRFSALEIVVANPQLAEKPILGRFRLDQPDATIDALAATYGFKVSRKANKIVVDY